MIRPVLKTPELLIKLSRIIGHDVADLDNAGTRHFVKHDNATDPDRQRARNVRLWGPSSVARTLRYLRMRKLGSKGSVLKLQLFIQDGEGWDNVKGTCREGLSRLIDGSLNGVRRYDRRVGFDDYAIESIRDHQYDALKRHSPNGTTAQPTSVETTSLVIGMLCNGRTLNGSSSRRLAVPILKALIPRAPDNFV